MSKPTIQALVAAGLVLLLIVGSNVYLNLRFGPAVPTEEQIAAFERRATVALWLVVGALCAIGFAAVIVGAIRGWRAASGLFLGWLYGLVVSINAVLAWRPLRVAAIIPLTLGVAALVFAVTKRRAMLRQSAMILAISVVTLLSIKLFTWAM